MAINVLAGGMKIDSNGFNVGIPLAILSGAAADGGLEKKGQGILTLTGSVGYNGPTLITAPATLTNQGRLAIDNGLTTTLSTVTGANGEFSVGATQAATVVNATSINVDTLTIGGGFYAPLYSPQSTTLTGTSPSDKPSGSNYEFGGVAPINNGIAPVPGPSTGVLAAPVNNGIAPVPEPSTIVLLVLAGLAHFWPGVGSNVCVNSTLPSSVRRGEL